MLEKGDPVQLDLLVRSNLVQQELTRLGINRIEPLNNTVSVARDVMQKLRDLLDRDIEKLDHESMETMYRLTIPERTEKGPVVIGSRDVERDCQSIVNQLVKSISKDVSLRISYVGRQQLTSTRPTQGVSVELKSSMARRVEFVDAKKKFEPCSNCSS